MKLTDGCVCEDIVFRRILRGEAPLSAKSSTSWEQRQPDNIDPLPELSQDIIQKTQPYAVEIVQTLIAGGVAGSLSAILTYPYVLTYLVNWRLIC